MLHAPHALPDECARGYLGRILRLNGAPESLNQAMAFVLQDGNSPLPVGYSARRMLAKLAALAGQQLPEFVRAHTRIPLHGAVFLGGGAEWCDESSESRALRASEIHLGDDAWTLCADCAREDMWFWGFSYWRRSHQAIGVVLCSKHGCALRQRRGASAWRQMPHEVAALSQQFPDDVIRDATDNPVLRRWAGIVGELWQRPAPLSCIQVGRSLHERAHRLGLTAELGRDGATFSAWAHDRIPGPWHRMFWPASARRKGRSLDDTLSRLRGIPPALTYVLAVALLFDNVDDAMGNLARPLPLLAWHQFADAGGAEELHRLVRSVRAGGEQEGWKALGLGVEYVLRGYATHEAATKAHVAPELLEQALLRWLVMESSAARLTDGTEVGQDRAEARLGVRRRRASTRDRVERGRGFAWT